MTPAPTAPGSTASARGTRDVPLQRQLATVREMVASLDTLTLAGQRHLMAKVVTFMRDHGLVALRQVGRNDQRTAAELLEHLSVESERRLPDAGAFGPCAETLVELLAEVA